MAVVVFLRGVNVGRHKRFLPAQLVKELEALDAVNVGAAGTFVIRAPVSQATVRREISQRLEFEAEMAIVAGRELIQFAISEPFGKRPPAANEQQFATVLLKRPRTHPALPMVVPPRDTWQVKVIAVSGQFVASVWRRQPGTPLYPNAAIEKEIGAGTTRNWNTIRTICKILQP